MYLKKFLMTMAAALCMLPLSAINPQNSKMKELSAGTTTLKDGMTTLDSGRVGSGSSG